jgi:hypothetical protein
MAQGDFVIPPSEELSVSGAPGYGTAISALRSAGAGIQDMFTHLGKASQKLYAIRNDQMDAASQGDLLHIINDLNDTAAQLGSDPKGMTAIYSETGNVDSEGNAEKTISGYNLGPAWEKKMDDWQKVLTEKYAAFPTIQAKVLTQFRDAAVNANKFAIDAAARNSLEQGKTESLNNIQLGIQSAIKSGGDTSQLDATLANPSTINFLGKGTVEAQRKLAYQMVGDSVLQNQLNRIALEKGPDTAILAIPDFVSDATANKLKTSILMNGNAYQGKLASQAVQDYDKMRKDGAVDSDAQQSALAKVPDWAYEAASKLVKTHATRIINEADDGATKKLETSAATDGFAKTLEALNKDPSYVADLKPANYRSWYNFLNARVHEEDNGPINLNDPAFLPYMMDAFDKTKGEGQKLQEWRDLVTAKKITGKQFDWLSEHQKYNSDTLYNVLTMIHDKTVTNPKTGLVDLDPILGMHVANSVEEFITNRARAGKYPDPGEVQAYADKLVKDEMTKNYQKYFDDSQGFSASGWAQFWGLGPIDANKLNDVQSRVEAGDFIDYGKTTEGMQKLSLVRTAQQTEFESLYPKIKFGPTPKGQPALDDMGRQFFYSGANVFSRVVQNGKGVWATKKITDPASAWAPLVK